MMNGIPTYVVIPTKDRPDMLMDCVLSIKQQVISIVVLNTGSPNLDLPVGEDVYVWDIDLAGKLPNIQGLWNIGIRAVEQLTDEPEFNVLVLNDDVVCPPSLVAKLSDSLLTWGATLAYPSQFGHRESIIHRRAEPVDLQTRITGYAYMLRGGKRMRLDERFVWWYGDDDLDWRCRENGGAVMVPFCAVEHRSPNGWQVTNPELIAQTALDRQKFINKWGKAPH